MKGKYRSIHILYDKIEAKSRIAYSLKRNHLLYILSAKSAILPIRKNNFIPDLYKTIICYNYSNFNNIEILLHQQHLLSSSPFCGRNNGHWAIIFHASFIYPAKEQKNVKNVGSKLLFEEFRCNCILCVFKAGMDPEIPSGCNLGGI
jgi:hypothetical protein